VFAHVTDWTLGVAGSRVIMMKGGCHTRKKQDTGYENRKILTHEKLIPEIFYFSIRAALFFIRV
jgi:hypothetical protein